MPTTKLSVIKVGAIAGTRAALGAGVGLLIADKFDERTRKAVGVGLVTVGLLSTFPLAITVVKGIGTPGSS